MKKRQLKEQFSTFLHLINTSTQFSCIWKPSDELVNNLEQIISDESNVSEKYLVELFVKEIKTQTSRQLPKRHISAYLEDICYWLGIKTQSKVKTFDSTWLDCFQIARTIVAECDDFILSYDSTRSSLKTYVKLKLETSILEVIRVNHEIEKYSPAGLLRKITKKKLKESLISQGISTQEINQYLLALQVFKTFYKPQKPRGNQRIPWTEQKELTALVKHYNKLSQHETTTNEKLESLLLFCVQAIRTSANPNITYIDEFAQDLESQTIANDLWETESDLQEWKQVNSILTSHFQTFDSETQRILHLFFGLEITQTEIANLFNRKPYQISRLVSRQKSQLLIKLAQKLKVTLSSDDIKNKADALDHWLNWYCKSTYHQVLKKSLVKLLSKDSRLVKSYIINEGNLVKIANELQIPSEAVDLQISNLKLKLRTALENEKNLKLEKNSSQTKLKNLVEQWLLNVPYAALEAEILD